MTYDPVGKDVPIDEEISHILNDPGYRMRWMDHPVRNLCASVGIERARLAAHSPLSSGWRLQVERCSAVEDALARIRKDGWKDAFEEMTLFMDAGKMSPWGIAVVLARALGVDHVKEET